MKFLENNRALFWWILNGSMIIVLYFAIVTANPLLMISVQTIVWLNVILTLPLLSENIILILVKDNALTPPVSIYTIIIYDLCIVMLFVYTGNLITAFGWCMQMFIAVNSYYIAAKLRSA